MIDKGYAYESQGDVYYRTRKFDGYGKLSGKNIDELIQGASERTRSTDDMKKEDPLDFALWKARKEPSEIAWESPWGMGRPGWHIECSTMAKKYLGPTIDIHAGGEDLQFPHHENEIAQSEAHNGCEFSHYWMHNAYINSDGTKMSKSLGNFKTVRDLLQHYDGEVLRFLILSGQYRGPIDFNSEILEQSKNAMTRLRNAKSNLKHLIETGSGNMTEAEKEKLAGYDKYRQEFIQAMDDDLNTADALAVIFELIREINSNIQGENLENAGYIDYAAALYEELTQVLGLLYNKKEEEIPSDILALVAERAAARKAKDFARADALRDEIVSKGYLVEETRQGTKVSKKN